MDCVKLTLLGTQRTADTANLAGCLDSRSTIVGAALYQMFCLVRYQVDQVFRAGCHAGTTRYTLLFVYNRYAVYHVDCIEFTCLHTGSETGTAVRTCLCTATRYNGCLRTVLDTMVLVLYFCLVAGTFTFNESYLLLRGTSLYAHDSSDLLANRSTADRAGINRSFALCDGLCKTITARVTTATAVVAWQLFTNSCLFFIYFNFKFRAEQGARQPSEFRVRRFAVEKEGIT